MHPIVYMDHSATTPVLPQVLEAMLPYLKGEYGNPSSVYSLGRQAHIALDEARKKVAVALNANPAEIYFTACGSESDNWALKGVAHQLAPKGKKHIITTVFEHHAILHSCAALEKEGFEVTYLPVDAYGQITPEQVQAAIRPDTALVSIMYANNEIGSILPIPAIGAVCREAGVLFHTDAVQAVGNVPIDVRAQNIDLLSLSGHKLGAMKGVGVLYLRKGVGIQNFMDGGSQERGMRAGTENVAGIVGLGVAIEEAYRDFDAKNAHKQALRDQLITQLMKLPRTHLNGDPVQRMPGNVNISFEGVEGESLLLKLDMAGICASSGSACTSGSLDPSHVLLAIGLKHEVAHGSLRLSLGSQNTQEEVDYVLQVLPAIVEQLRSMSPLWEKLQKEDA